MAGLLDQQHSLPATASGLLSLTFTPPTWHWKHRSKYVVLSWQRLPRARHLASSPCPCSHWYGCRGKSVGLARARLCQTEQARNWGVNKRGLWVLWSFFLSFCSPFQVKNLERFFFGQISFSQRKVVQIPVLGLSGDAERLARWSPKSVNGQC